MIEAGLEFEGSIHPVLETICRLPELLRPVHFCIDERAPKNKDRIADQERFAKFVAKSPSGFFLFGPGSTYSLIIEEGRGVDLFCLLDVAPEVAVTLMIHMAKADPIFGYACVSEERLRRNRVGARWHASSIEGWVGRDTRKYVPGLYWLTLLPEALAKRHGVALPEIAAVAKEHTELGSGQHLFRLYEQPEDWQRTQIVTDLIASLPGVFDVDKIAPIVSGAKDWRVFNDLTKGWK